MTCDHDGERLRRSVQRTIRSVILVITTLTGLALACLKPEVAWPIAAMIGFLCVCSLFIEYFNREDRSS